MSKDALGSGDAGQADAAAGGEHDASADRAAAGADVGKSRLPAEVDCVVGRATRDVGELGGVDADGPARPNP
jgi:hypothetical protein